MELVEFRPIDLDMLREFTPLELREFVHNSEDRIKESDRALTREQAAEIVHHFGNLTYGREMRIAQGMMVVGEIHKFANINILSQGIVTVISQDGVKTIEAPFTWVGSPLTKRMIYAHEHAVWTVIHGTDKTDVELIEKEVIAKDYSQGE